MCVRLAFGGLLMNSLQKTRLAVMGGIAVCVASLGFIAFSGAQADSKPIPLGFSYGLSSAGECIAVKGRMRCDAVDQITPFVAPEKATFLSSKGTAARLSKDKLALVATQ